MITESPRESEAKAETRHAPAAQDVQTNTFDRRTDVMLVPSRG
jgi:hypothetical protein